MEPVSSYIAATKEAKRYKQQGAFYFYMPPGAGQIIGVGKRDNLQQKEQAATDHERVA